ncbi:hypothetical protein ACEN2I_16015 [Flavobacterium sp. W22_SRS_FK3]|uniref:hypothetical protein n=1 Tax=Flavobacterium sp. W22_SRS_FK3 TaxID=3240275 RepID=UPI003F92AE4A
MEKQNSHEYRQTDPDIIDQNALIDSSHIQSKKISQQDFNKEVQQNLEKVILII